MKDYDQILRHTVENVFPAIPISDQGHCDKRKDATPGGFFPIPSFVPSPPPYFVMLWRWCFYHRVLFLTPVSLFYSLSLSCFVLLPISPPSLWIEKERCWFPKAGCSSLNNSSWFPVVLSPVLHQSITPLHKDVQMGWDPYVHAHFRQKHKHGPVRVPMVIHTAMRVSQCAKCVSWSSNKAPFTSCSVLFLLSQRVRQTFSNFPHLHRCFFFSLSVSPTQSLTRSLSYSIPPPHSLRIHRRLMRTQHRLAYLPAFLPSVQQKSLTVTQWLHQKHQ